MAGVFSFGKDVLKDEDQPKGAKAIAQLEKALKGKKVPPRQITMFVERLKHQDFKQIQTDADDFMQKHLISPPTIQDATSKNPAKRAMMHAKLAPQVKVLTARFDLSVHIKGGNVELYVTDCKGRTQRLFSVPPPPPTHT